MSTAVLLPIQPPFFHQEKALLSPGFEVRQVHVRKVFTGESDKFLVIIGPCSADNEEAVLDYAGRLAKVNEKVGDKLILIPRIYTNKPRTTGEG